ncbi:hypothetical protein BGZ97_009638, partial [Linnemannia gamsii]
PGLTYSPPNSESSAPKLMGGPRTSPPDLVDPLLTLWPLSTMDSLVFTSVGKSSLSRRASEFEML